MLTYPICKGIQAIVIEKTKVIFIISGLEKQPQQNITLSRLAKVMKLFLSLTLYKNKLYYLSLTNLFHLRVRRGEKDTRDLNPY
jgi:hypothetical protein